MHKDIKDVLDVYTEHLTFDSNLYKNIKSFRISWMQKSPEYIDFLGGKTLGTQAIRFSTLDEDNFMIDVLGLDKVTLRTELHNVKGINPTWAISSNPIYLTLLYIIHRFINSKDIGKNKEEAIRETILIFYYKVIGSLISHYFTYNTTETIAVSVVEKLSNRFMIKKLDNWQEVFIYRSNDMIPNKGLHTKRLIRYNTDDAIYIANDAQGRIRDMVKNIYLVMLEITDNNNVITTTSAIDHQEDGDGIKDITERPSKYIIYGKEIYNKDSFIDADILYLIINNFSNIEQQQLRDTLLYINKHDKNNSNINLIEVIITESLQYINNKNITNDYVSRINELIKHIKGYWSTNLSKKKEMVVVKKHINKLVKSSVKKRTTWLLNGLTIAIITYIFVRVIVRDNNQ